MTFSTPATIALLASVALISGCEPAAPLADEEAQTSVALASQDGSPVDLNRSPCLDRPEDQIVVVPPGLYKEGKRFSGLRQQTVDMRGTMFHGNPPKRPISFRPLGETCILGPSIQGQQPRDWTWQRMKSSEDHAYDGDAIGWGGKEMRGPVIIEGAWIDNFEDGLGPPKQPGKTAERRWSVRHVYARNIRDDFIENDGCIDLEVRDTLVDGTFAFISARPGRSVGPGGAERPAHTVIEDTLVHMQCMPGEFGPENCGPGLDMGQIFKWSACGGEVEVRNSIFLVDPRDTRELYFPDGTYEDVVIIWPAAEGAAFPADGGLPEGIELSRDVSLWHEARTDWLRRHGCKPDGTECAYLRTSE